MKTENESYRPKDRDLEWSGCYNVRDLGGLPAMPGKRTRRKAFVRSDVLGRLTSEGKRTMIDYGIRTFDFLKSSSVIRPYRLPTFRSAICLITTTYRSAKTIPNSGMIFIRLEILRVTMVSGLNDTGTTSRRFCAQCSNLGQEVSCFIVIPERIEQGCLPRCYCALPEYQEIT